jgi:hypothetical protein
MLESIKHEILSLFLHLEQKNFTVKLWQEDDLVGEVRFRVQLFAAKILDSIALLNRSTLIVILLCGNPSELLKKNSMVVEERSTSCYTQMISFLPPQQATQLSRM